MELERRQGRQSMEPPPPRLCDESPVAESSEPKSGKFRGVTRGTPGGAMPGGFPGHSAARGVGAPSGGKIMKKRESNLERRADGPRWPILGNVLGNS